MNNTSFSEQELEKMLTSGNKSLIEQALKYIYLANDWRTTIQNTMDCSTIFFDNHFVKLIASLKIWLAESANRPILETKGLPTILKQLWREYTAVFTTEADLLGMFRANDRTTSLAMEICFQRFSPKIKATLMKNKPDSTAVEEVLQDTFINVFERFKKADEQFSFKTNMEAYITQSCKHAYWKHWNKAGITFENIENSAEVATWAANDYQIDNDRGNCFEKVVFPKLGNTCKRILGMAYEGYKNPEIAKYFDYSVGYVKKKKSECLDKAKALAKELCSTF